MKACVSLCLTGEPCRWKGDSKPADLSALVPEGAEVVAFCPECAAGMGVPRPPIELVEDPAGGEPRVMRVDRSADATEALRAACEAQVGHLRENGGADVFVLKSNSPSCGLSSPVRDSAGRDTGARAPGIWARTAMHAFPEAEFVCSGKAVERKAGNGERNAEEGHGWRGTLRALRSSYVARRLLQLVPTLLGVTLLTFVLFNVVGGSPALQVLGKNATAEQIAEYDHAHGWDRPLAVQYLDYLGDLCRGDFGESLQYRQPVWQVLRRGVGVSLALTVPILVVGTCAALLLGLLCAASAGKWPDKAMLGATTALMSVNYVIWVSAGQYLLAYRWKLFPVWGFRNWTYLALPILVGVLSGLGSDVRFYRTVVLDEIRKPYVRTAIAKGLSPARILLRHVLRCSLVPVITNASLAVPFLFTGSILLESFFGLPGLGGIGLDAVYAADYATVRAVVVVSAVLYQLSNLAADLLNAALDPRAAVRV